MTANYSTGSVSARFSAAARTYDAAAGVQHAAAELLMELLEKEVPDPERALEIGCGTGILTAMLAERFPQAQIHGTDVAEGLLEVARAQFAEYPRVSFENADARDLAVPRPFPLAVSSSSLHWMQPLEEVFASIRRATATGGRLAFLMMIEGTLASLRESRARVAPRKPAPGKLPDAGQALECVRECGFEILTERIRDLPMHYASARDFLRTVHDVGVTAGYATAGACLNRGELAALISDYQTNNAENGGVRATYRALLVLARKV
jgi:malonyl-CoA O-methyltransferase